MSIFKERILSEGKVYPNNVLKVDSFLNHQIDPRLMEELADSFYQEFKDARVTKVMTVEASGIAPAILAAYKLDVPMLFAKKQKPSTIEKKEFLSAMVHSYTKDTDNRVIVSSKYLSPEDRVLIIDDFLANGEAAMGLVSLVEQANATVVGVGICVEKSFQEGRKRLEDHGVHVYSEARIASLDNETVTFIDGH